MRVGIFLDPDTPESGGSYTFIDTIVSALSKLAAQSNHEFVIFGSQLEPPAICQDRSCLRYVSLAGGNQEPLWHKIFRRIARLFYAVRYPTAHLQLETWREKIISSELESQTIDLIWHLSPGTPTVKIPFITTVWDLAHRIHPYFPEVSVYKLGSWNDREHGYQSVLPRSSYIFTGTEVGKAEIERFYQIPAARIKVLAFPTPEFALENIAGADRSILNKYDLPENYLFYPAQFWPHKNHINLLLALKRLRDRDGISITLVLSGSDRGNQKYIESAVAQLELTPLVKFLGFVPRSDPIQLYRHALALVYVTFFGPDNLPPLEAFALGCPTIASNISGSCEQLGDAILSIDPTDPSDIAAAIKTLWGSPDLRQQLIARGYQRARQWTSQDYIKSVFDILDEFEPIRRCWSGSSILDGTAAKM